MDAKKLGKRIRLARVEADLTQTQLARKMDAKQKSISRYETGASVPSVETLVRLAKVLKKPTTFFLDDLA
jgi:transcriptional regulator with XRE-family HTH domain